MTQEMPETPVTQQISQKSQLSNAEKRSVLSEIDSMEYEKNKDVPIDILCEHWKKLEIESIFTVLIKFQSSVWKNKSFSYVSYFQRRTRFKISQLFCRQNTKKL